MASIGQIQRFPRGLLQFLQMVGTGRSPTDLGSEVTPTLSMLPFYGAGLMERVGTSLTNGGTGVGVSVTATVPRNESWLCLALNATLGVMALGDISRVSVRIVSKDGGVIQVGESELMTAQAAGAIHSTGFMLPQPVLLVSGESIRNTINDAVLAGPVDIGIWALAYRIPS